MTRTFLVGLCALLTLSCATGSHRSGVTGTEGIARGGAMSDRDCDPATNGALIGAAIGATPLLALLVPPNDEGDIPYMFAGLIGAIAGFWIGVGVDEAHCEPMEHRANIDHGNRLAN